MILPDSLTPKEAAAEERRLLLRFVAAARNLRNLVGPRPNAREGFYIPEDSSTGPLVKMYVDEMDRVYRDAVALGAMFGGHEETIPRHPDGREYRKQANTRLTGERCVIVCGIPSSCNRLVKRILVGAGAKVHIAHGIAFGVKEPEIFSVVKHFQESGAADIRAVMPVRDPFAWRMSQRYGRPNVHDIGPLNATYEYATDAWRNTVRGLAITDIPWMPLSIEALAANPKTVMREMLAWCGFDEDAIRRGLTNAERVIDPNAKYYGPDKSWKQDKPRGKRRRAAAGG